jgi:hypothetical protein
MEWLEKFLPKPHTASAREHSATFSQRPKRHGVPGGASSVLLK